jgi:hypothetical protein
MAWISFFLTEDTFTPPTLGAKERQGQQQPRDRVGVHHALHIRSVPCCWWAWASTPGSCLLSWVDAGVHASRPNGPGRSRQPSQARAHAPGAAMAPMLVCIPPGQTALQRLLRPDGPRRSTASADQRGLDTVGATHRRAALQPAGLTVGRGHARLGPAHVDGVAHRAPAAVGTWDVPRIISAAAGIVGLQVLAALVRCRGEVDSVSAVVR